MMVTMAPDDSPPLCVRAVRRRLPLGRRSPYGCLPPLPRDLSRAYQRKQPALEEQAVDVVYEFQGPS